MSIIKSVKKTDSIGVGKCLNFDSMLYMGWLCEFAGNEKASNCRLEA